jgi:ribose transport system permease protein
MPAPRIPPAVARFVSDYGMLFVLVLLCAYYSWMTLEEQHPSGPSGAAQLARQIARNFQPGARVLIATRETGQGVEFAESLQRRLTEAGFHVAGAVRGQPSDIRQALDTLAADGNPLDLIACDESVASWTVFDDLDRKAPSLGNPKIVVPESYRWPNFLKTANLLNVANQIVVIAILAIGVTMVIIAGGIDLSVGSLIALAAVVGTLFIRNLAGAEDASALGMTAGCLTGIAVCGGIGFFSGVMVTLCGIPAFIATLAMMLVASGLAFIVAQGQSVYQVPDTFVWLGRGADLGIPNAVVLMALLYGLAHLLMTRTTLGRYIYAVGGNAEAARLSGVPVKRVRLFVFTASGALAGLGGIIMASQLRSGSPTYGQIYELYVIAAVVVGGTSLSGGEGKIFGTLIGALIIGVIQNGMNLTGVESYTQKVVLGLVILGALLLDRLKRRGWDVAAAFLGRRSGQ